MKISLRIIIILLLSGIDISAKPIPFDPSRGLVKIDVVIDGHIQGKFGIDTGADRLYMDKTFAEKNGIDVLRAPAQRNIQSVDGSTKAYAASLKSFSLSDNAVLKNISATVVDMKKLTNNASDLVLDGLIGNRILRQFYVSIDYPGHLLELSTQQPRFLSGNQYSTIDYSRYRDYIIVDVVINNKMTVPMLFDYCSSHTVLSPELAEELELEIPENKRVELASIRLGDKESKDVKTVVRDLTSLKKSTPRAQFQGIIGATFLNAFRITVDYKKKKIYIQK